MSGAEYRFLDCGHGRRLEELGGVVVDRPAPAAAFAPGLEAAAWRRAGLVFSREAGWEGTPPDGWRVVLDGACLALRPAAGGQIGVFPEHAAVAESLAGRVKKLFPSGAVAALNLFAHTGLLTLRLAAGGGVEIAHVDAAPAAVRQARENAALSGLDGAPVRWLVDDALAFMNRERRRGRLYNVVAADPPSFGRAGKGAREWKFDRDVGGLLRAAAALFAPGPGVFCLTCHSEGWTAERVAGTVREAFPGWEIRTENLALRSGAGGGTLRAGLAAYAWRGW